MADIYKNRHVPVKHILEPSHQLRMTFDEEKIHELAESMKQHGLINPITLHEDEEHRLMIIAGHRRFLAARILKWETIPARIRKTTDTINVKIIAAVENLQRADLDIIEEADFVGDLYYEQKLSIGDIEKLLNRKTQWVQTRIELRQYPIDVLQALQLKTIKIGVARMIAAQQDTIFRNWILDMAVNSGATETMVTQWIKDHKSGITPEEATQLIEQHSLGTVEYLDKTKFVCGLCFAEDTLSNVMIVRVDKSCYLELERLRAQHELQQRTNKNQEKEVSKNDS